MKNDPKRQAARLPTPGAQARKNAQQRLDPNRHVSRERAVAASPRGVAIESAAMPANKQHPQLTRSTSSKPTKVRIPPANQEPPGSPNTTVERLLRFGQELAACDKSFADKRATFLAQIVVIARNARRRRDVWAEICAAPFWENRQRARPNPEKPERVLLACLQLALAATEPAMLTAASRYAKALDELVKSEFSGPDIAKHIREAGGIDGLLRERKSAAVRRASILELSFDDCDQLARFIEGMPDGSEVSLRCTVVVAKGDGRTLQYDEITAEAAP